MIYAPVDINCRTNSAKKKQKEYAMGFSPSVGNLVYNKPVKSPMIKRDAK